MTSEKIRSAPFSNFFRDTVPVRLPSGGKAILDLPRPLTAADAAHLCAWVAQYVEGGQADNKEVTGARAGAYEKT